MSLQEGLDALCLDETKKLLAQLAMCLSKQTRISVASPGTKICNFVEFAKPGIYAVHLIPFFGKLVGYNKEHDILVIADFE